MKKSILLLSTFSIGFASIVSAQSITGKIKLPKGQQLEEVSTVKAVTTMEMMGQNIETNVNTTANNAIEVKETGSDLVFSTKITRFRMNMSVMGQEQNVDTDNQEDMAGPMGAGFKDIINKEQKITVDKNGIIKAIQSEDSSANEMMKQMAGAQNAMMVGGPFSAVTGLNGKTLKVGDSFQESVKSDALSSETTYTLKSVSGNEATFSFTGKATVKNKMEQQGMEIVTNATGDMTGDMVMDHTTGMVKKRTLKMDMTGTLDMMGQKAPMKISSVTESVFSKK